MMKINRSLKPFSGRTASFPWLLGPCQGARDRGRVLVSGAPRARCSGAGIRAGAPRPGAPPPCFETYQKGLSSSISGLEMAHFEAENHHFEAF